MNVVTIMGRLTADPETRYTKDGAAVARYTLAVDAGKEHTDFIRIVAFGKAGEFTDKYLKKGLRVCVNGHIQTGSYTDKDGKRAYTWDVVAERQEFADGKAEKPAEPSNRWASVNEDEIPFM